MSEADKLWHDFERARLNICQRALADVANWGPASRYVLGSWMELWIRLARACRARLWELKDFAI